MERKSSKHQNIKTHDKGSYAANDTADGAFTDTDAARIIISRIK